jgi:hypothetical protein
MIFTIAISCPRPKAAHSPASSLITFRVTFVMLVPLVNDHVALIPTKAVGKMVFEIDNEC